MQYFNEDQQTYLIDIKRDNSTFYKYNNRFLGYYTEEEGYRDFSSKGDLRHKDMELSKKVNYYFAFLLFSYDAHLSIAYRVIMFLLQTRLDFSIKTLDKECAFVNIIQHNIYECWRNKGVIYNDSEIMVKAKIDYSKDFLSELVSILHINDMFSNAADVFKRKENFKNKTLLLFDLLINELFEMYENKKIHIPKYLYPERMVSENRFHEIEDELLEKHYRQETTKEIVERFETRKTTEPKSIEVIEENKDSKLIEETKAIDELDCYYESLTIELDKYIERGTPGNYRKIVEDRKFDSNKKYIVFKSDTKSDWVLFAKTFNLDIKELARVAKCKDGKNLKPIDITVVYFNSQKEKPMNHKGEDFEKALITVRNNFLNKINPDKFPIFDKEES